MFSRLINIVLVSNRQKNDCLFTKVKRFDIDPVCPRVEKVDVGTVFTSVKKKKFDIDPVRTRVENGRHRFGFYEVKKF